MMFLTVAWVVTYCLIGAVVYRPLLSFLKLRSYQTVGEGFNAPVRRFSRYAAATLLSLTWPLSLLVFGLGGHLTGKADDDEDEEELEHAEVPGGPVEPLSPSSLEEAAFPGIDIPVPWFDEEGQEAMLDLGARLGVHPLMFPENHPELGHWFDVPEGKYDRTLSGSVLALDKLIPDDAYRKLVWRKAVNYALSSTVASYYMAERSAAGAEQSELDEIEELRVKMRRACLLFRDGVELADNSATGGLVLENLLGSKKIGEEKGGSS